MAKELVQRLKSGYTSRALVTVALALFVLSGIPFDTQGQGQVGSNSPAELDRSSTATGSSFVRYQHRRRRKRSRRRRTWKAPTTTTAERSKTIDTATRKVPVGAWGGDHIALTVTQEGASFEIDCAHGTINESLLIDRNGRFDVRGIYVREGGGDVQGGGRERHPARFTGWSNGKRMTLTIKFTDTGQTISEFTLTLGQEPNMTKCL